MRKKDGKRKNGQLSGEQNLIEMLIVEKNTLNFPPPNRSAVYKLAGYREIESEESSQAPKASADKHTSSVAYTHTHTRKTSAKKLCAKFKWKKQRIV